MPDRLISADALLKEAMQEGAYGYVDAWEIENAPTVDAVEVVRCKDCKYFHYNKIYDIQGFPIMGNSICDKWANGCRTDENGYCFLGERREDG